MTGNWFVNLIKLTNQITDAPFPPPPKFIWLWFAVTLIQILVAFYELFEIGLYTLYDAWVGQMSSDMTKSYPKSVEKVVF